MAWKFPDGLPFDIRTKDDYFSNARLVEADPEHVTVDYESKGNIILRAQIEVEGITSLVYRAPIEEEIRHASEIRQTATVHGDVREEPGGGTGLLSA